MKKQNRERALEELRSGQAWANVCLTRICRVVNYFDFVRSNYSDPEKVFYGPVFKGVFTGKSIAITHLKQLLETDFLPKHDLIQTLKDFTESGAVKSLHHYEIGNAYNLTPIEFRGESHSTAVKAIFEVGKFVAKEILGRIDLLSRYWKQSQINEDQIRASIDDLLSISKVAAVVEDSLLRTLICQVDLETIRATRWIYEIYGYESPEYKAPQNIEIQAPQSLSAVQIMEVKREHHSNIDKSGRQIKEFKRPWLSAASKAWPEPDIFKSKGGAGLPHVWSLNLILNYLLESFPEVEKELWVAKASERSE